MNCPICQNKFINYMYCYTCGYVYFRSLNEMYVLQNDRNVEKFIYKGSFEQCIKVFESFKAFL